MRRLRLLLAAAALLLAPYHAFAQTGNCPANTFGLATPVTALPYTIGQADYCLMKAFASGPAGTVFLPAPGTAGGFYPNFTAFLFNVGPGTLTLIAQSNAAGVTPLIQGNTTINVNQGAILAVGTDGNWYAQPTNAGSITNNTTFVTRNIFNGAQFVPGGEVPIIGLGNFGPIGSHFFPQGWIQFTGPLGQPVWMEFY